jgi:hypothetical protein
MKVKNRVIASEARQSMHLEVLYKLAMRANCSRHGLENRRNGRIS